MLKKAKELDFICQQTYHCIYKMFLKIGGNVLPADPKEKDGDDEPPGTSQQESPEEFTDTKHESLFSLETNFLEEESGGHCPLKASQGQNSSGA